MRTRGRRAPPSDGSPRRDPNPLGALSSALAHLRQSKRLTQGDVAEKLQISRSYYSLLETGGDKEPSLEFLRRLSTLLVGEELESPERLRDAARLGLAALGFEFKDPFAELIGDSEDELKIQADPAVKGVWIMSSVLGEVRDPRALRRTVANLVRPDPVHYVFFVPHGRNEWSTCLRLIEAAVPRGQAASLSDGRLRAVACPQLTCVPPVSIVHLTTTRKATVTLGNPTVDPLFYALDQSQIDAIVTELEQVLSGLQSEVTWQAEHASYTRLYPNTSRKP